MPLYEYQCDSCGHRFEVIQKFSDAPVEACPACPGTVRRLLSSPAIQFKGSGWYITDYARKGGAGGSSGGEKTSGEKASDGKTSDGKAAEAKADTGGASAPASGDAKKD